MNMAAKAFIARLKSESDVSLAVGGRIHLGHAPPDTAAPYIVVIRSFTRREPHQAGVAPVAFIQLSVDSYAVTLTEAGEIGDKIRLSCNGLVNTVIGTPPEQVNVAALILRDEFADPVEQKSGAGHTLYRWSQDWVTWADEVEAAPV